MLKNFRRTPRRLGAAVALAACAATVLSACGGSGGSGGSGGTATGAKTDDITVGVFTGSLADLPVLVAQEKGIFTKEGLNVTTTPVAGGAAASVGLGGWCLSPRGDPGSRSSLRENVLMTQWSCLRGES